MKRPYLFVTFALLCALLASCAKQEKPPAEPEGFDMLDGMAIFGVPVNQPERPNPATKLATVDDTSITQGQFDSMVMKILSRLGNQQFAPEQKAQVRQQILQRALEELVVQTLVVNHLEKEPVTIDAKKIDEQIDLLRKKTPEGKTFEAHLTENRTTEALIRTQIEAELNVLKLREEKAKLEKPVTEEEAKKFYDENPDKFKAPADVRLRHILINKAQTDKEAELTAKKARAETLLQQLKDGADFAALAKLHSTDPASKDQGGDLGYAQRGRFAKIAPALDDLVFSLEVNRYSDVFETQYGFHILEVTEKRPTRKISFEATKEQLLKGITRGKQQDNVARFLKNLRKDAVIKFFNPDGTERVAPEPGKEKPSGEKPAPKPPVSAPKTP
jgi:peptidyl-prolyl cis-trans isomerase C